MNTYELRKKKGMKSSVYAIAFVKNPAIEVGFVALSKDNPKQRISRIKLSEERKMIYTPVLIPEQKIYREDESGEPYQIYFTAETIEEAAHDFVSAKLVDNFNNEHQENEKLNGISLVENWIIENPATDKATALGFDLPKGTWMAGIKVHDADVWKMCKDGTYEGISIEGLFDNFTENFNNENDIKMNKLETKVDSILTKLNGLLSPKTKLASAELVDGGMIYTEGEWEDGVNVYTDEALDNLAEDGEYELANGRIVTVVEGKVAGMVERQEEDLEKTKDKEKMSGDLEELAKHVLSNAESIATIKEMLEAAKKDVAELKDQKVSQLEKENEAVKAELTKLKETPAGKSSLKLSEAAAKEGRLAKVLRGEMRQF